MHASVHTNVSAHVNASLRMCVRKCHSQVPLLESNALLYCQLWQGLSSRGVQSHEPGVDIFWWWMTFEDTGAALQSCQSCWANRRETYVNSGVNLECTILPWRSYLGREPITTKIIVDSLDMVILPTRVLMIVVSRLALHSVYPLNMKYLQREN